MHRLVLMLVMAAAGCSLELPAQGSVRDDVDTSHVTPLPGDAGFAAPFPLDAALPSPGVPGDATTAVADATTQTDAEANADASAVPPLASQLMLTSPAITNGGSIPAAFTCAGADESPPFAWSGAPSTTAAFALTLTVRGLGPFGGASVTQWVLWNIPATRSELPRTVEAGAEPSNVPGARQTGVSSYFGPGGLGSGFFGGSGGPGGWGWSDDSDAGAAATELRYRGPCTPIAGAIAFDFTLYAQAAPVPTLPADVTPEAALARITDAGVLAQASLKASYP